MQTSLWKTLAATCAITLALGASAQTYAMPAPLAEQTVSTTTASNSTPANTSQLGVGEDIFCTLLSFWCWMTK